MKTKNFVVGQAGFSSQADLTDLLGNVSECGLNNYFQDLVKSAYQKNNFLFLIFQPKHMLWVLKRTVSMRRFF